MKAALLVFALLFTVALSLEVTDDVLLNLPQTPAPLLFKWYNCGSPSDPTKLTSLSVKPDPIVLGDNISVAASGILSASVIEGQGYNADVDIYKSVFGIWVYIPCVDDIGSCHIPDVCTKFHPNDHCPLAPWKIPCECPFAAGTYTVPPPGVSIHVHNPNISWLADGDYKIQVTLYTPKGVRMSCYVIEASLSTY